MPKERCPASTIFAGWRQSVLPVHLLGLDALLGCVGAVAGDVKLQDDGVVHDPVNRRGGGLGKLSSVAPWHDCERFHSQPDGTAGVNADGDLTHSPDYPTASQTCAGLVPERLLLHATLTISPSIATAGRHHRSCVPTSRRPHPHLLESGLPRSPSLAHHPWCQRQRTSLRWIRVEAKGIKGVITDDGLDLMIRSLEQMDKIASEGEKNGAPIYEETPDEPSADA